MSINTQVKAETGEPTETLTEFLRGINVVRLHKSICICIPYLSFRAMQIGDFLLFTTCWWIMKGSTSCLLTVRTHMWAEYFLRLPILKSWHREKPFKSKNHQKMWIPGCHIPHKRQSAGINSEEEGKNIKKNCLKSEVMKPASHSN